MNAILFIELTLLTTSSILAIIFYLSWRTMGREQYSLIWTLTYVAIVFQRIFNINKGEFDSPELHWMIVCTLSVLSVVLAAWGHILRSENKLPIKYIFGSSAIILFLTFYFTAIEPYAGLSMSLYVFYNALLLFCVGIIILKHPKKTMPAEIGAASAYITLAIFQLVAGSIALMQGETRNEALLEFYIMVNFVILPGAFIAMGLFTVFILASDLSERLAKLMEQKNKMLADVTHDLRTPLANIKMQLEAMEDGALDHSEKSYSLLQKKLSNLNHMVGDLYHLSLMESDSLVLNKREEEITSIVEESVESFQASAIRSKLSLSMYCVSNQDIHVYADRGRLLQAFNNLIKNSIRYTDSNGIIRITISTEREEVIITFEDTAPGVADTDLENLFNRLYQAENTKNRSNGGSGLGLSIVESIINAHEGRVTAAHSELGGLGVVVRLPRFSTTPEK